jgi:hypothetical protein
VDPGRGSQGPDGLDSRPVLDPPEPPAPVTAPQLALGSCRTFAARVRQALTANLDRSRDSHILLLQMLWIKRKAYATTLACVG